MASNIRIYVWDNGRKVYDSNTLSILFQALGVTADGSDNGLTISESSGKFSFNGKILGGIALPQASGQALIYDMLGAANGVPTLDAGQKIPVQFLPNSVMEYKASFNPSTHIPNLQDSGAAINSYLTIQDLTYTAITAGLLGNLITIAYTDGATAGSEVVSVVGNAISIQIESGVSTATQVRDAVIGSSEASALVSAAITGTASNPQTAPVTATKLDGGADEASQGDVYKASAPGTHDFGSGPITFVSGDYAVYNSSGQWELSHSGSDAVLSVNGKAGVVSLTTDDIPVGLTNLYWTQTLFNTAFSGKTTDALTEGTGNLYYTDGRARLATLAASVTSGDTTHAPTGDTLYNGYGPTGITLELTNNSGSAIAAGKFVYADPSSTNIWPLTSTLGSVEGAMIGYTKASIDDAASGLVYFPGRGTLLTGLTGLTPGLAVWATTSAGGWSHVMPVTNTDDQILLGFAVTTTSMVFIGFVRSDILTQTVSGTDYAHAPSNAAIKTYVDNQVSSVVGAALLNGVLGGETVAANKFVYVDKTTGLGHYLSSTKAIADDTLLAFAPTGLATTGGGSGIYLQKRGTRIAFPGAGFTPYQPIYSSSSDGGWTHTMPTSGKVIALGYATTTSEFLFTGEFQFEWGS